MSSGTCVSCWLPYSSTITISRRLRLPAFPSSRRQSGAPAAERKALTKMTDEGLKAHSFQTLLDDLATIVKNRIQPKDHTTAAFDMITTPTTIQQKALDLLGVPLLIK